jgi:Fe-S-cluster containining protein
MDGRLTADVLRALYATEEASAAAVLSAARDRNTPVKLVMGAAQRADRTFLPVFQAVACRTGCDFCCRGVRIDVTAAEALTIARGFRETLSAAQVAVIRDLVRAHANTVRAMTVDERYRARTPCALLDEASNRCAIYDARPMRCRAHHSLDAADCEAASRNPDELRIINRYPDVMDAAEVMILGQKDAVGAAQLDERHFELSLALEVALTHEDAAERWARGERIFDAAAFTWPDDDEEP